MNFNNNLVELRKREKMSQESLAEKIGVTRQTIYKWETSATYPEMDKLMDLAKVFNVSVDYLINGDILSEPEEVVSKEEIVKKVKSYGNNLGIAIGTILLGVAVMVGLIEVIEPVAIILGLSIIFASGVTIVLISMRMEAFKELNNLNITISKKEKLVAHNSFITKVGVALTLIFIGVGQLITVAIIVDKQGYVKEDMIMEISTSGLLVLIGIATYLFVQGGIIYELFTDSKKCLGKPSDIEKENELSGKICGCIMIISTAVFLGCGFIGDLWKTAWVAFPIGGLICAVVSTILSKEKKE